MSSLLDLKVPNIKTSNTVFFKKDQHKVQTLSNDIENINFNHAGSFVGVVERGRNSVHEICPMTGDKIPQIKRDS